jgi:hypothetical protein
VPYQEQPGLFDKTLNQIVEYRLLGIAYSSAIIGLITSCEGQRTT